MQWLPLLLILACPLMMIFMMRGMHGGGHQGHTGMHGDPDAGRTHAGCHGSGGRRRSIEDLRAQRDELDREIEEREQTERHEVGTQSL